MPNPDLEKYINSAREQKITDSEIREQLVKAGWSESDVTSALSPKSTSNINLPPPPVPQFGMWVTFQYILLFICLYVSATSLGGILHRVVDKYLPDNVDRIDYFGSYLLKGYLA